MIFRKGLGIPKRIWFKEIILYMKEIINMKEQKS